MATSQRDVRFLHLADLHLTPCLREAACGPGDAACHACIKAALLDRLVARFAAPATRPDLVLLAGDLTEHRDLGPNVRRAVAPLDRFVAAAWAKGITVAGITGDHDGENGTAVLRDTLGWDWLLGSGEVNRSSGVAVHGVEGRPNRRSVADDLSRLAPISGEPSVVLVHDDASALRSAPDSSFSYFAMGHLHQGRVRPARRGPRALFGYPGHLFSYWDGDGKAWPVHAIVGTIAADGTVEAELLPLSSLGAPETRRIYVDFADVGRSEGTIVFENSPSAPFFQDLGVAAEVADDFRQGIAFRRVAHLTYASRTDLRDRLHSIVSALPGDVFLTPSTGGGWRDRLADYGATIASRRFDEFAVKVFKKDAN